MKLMRCTCCAMLCTFVPCCAPCCADVQVNCQGAGGGWWGSTWKIDVMICRWSVRLRFHFLSTRPPIPSWFPSRTVPPFKCAVHFFSTGFICSWRRMPPRDYGALIPWHAINMAHMQYEHSVALQPQQRQSLMLPIKLCRYASCW